MNIFKIIIIVLISIEILGTLAAAYDGSDDCNYGDVLVLIASLVYVILN